MSYRLVPKSVTLNDIERHNGHYFLTNSLACVANSHCVKVVEPLKIHLNFLRQKYSRKHLVFSDISLTKLRRYDTHDIESLKSYSGVTRIFFISIRLLN